MMSIMTQQDIGKCGSVIHFLESAPSILQEKAWINVAKEEVIHTACVCQCNGIFCVSW